MREEVWCVDKTILAQKKEEFRQREIEEYVAAKIAQLSNPDTATHKVEAAQPGHEPQADPPGEIQAKTPTENLSAPVSPEKVVEVPAQGPPELRGCRATGSVPAPLLLLGLGWLFSRYRSTRPLQLRRSSHRSG